MSTLEILASQVYLNNCGANGGKEITGTSAVTPADGYYFCKIEVMSDTVVAAQGNVTNAINPDLTKITSIPAKTILYGKWNSITLTSGDAIGYYAKG
jgi:hypothetical protein